MNKSNENSISLNKYIAESGLCSRREADEYIKSGRVTINDAPTRPGNRVFSGDIVKVDGKPITPVKEEIYIALNKPRGIVSTADSREKNNIIDFLGLEERVFHIGRLDKDSEGLILLTNNGDIVNKILRAGNDHEKEYIVSVDKPITTVFLEKMAQGVPILDTVTLPAKVEQINRFTFKIILVQGLNRQIRRMCEYLGYEVKRLKRVRIMNINLGKLRKGEYRSLTHHELKTLKNMLGSSSRVRRKRSK